MNKESTKKIVTFVIVCIILKGTTGATIQERPEQKKCYQHEPGEFNYWKYHFFTSKPEPTTLSSPITTSTEEATTITTTTQEDDDYEDEKEAVTESLPPIETTTWIDPCLPYNPATPDFSAPGRRISDTKCLEYIWGMKVQIDKEKKKRDCEERRRLLEIARRESQNQLRERVTQILLGRISLVAEFPHMVGLRINNAPLHDQIVAVPQIIGGHFAVDAEFPHMGAIGWKNDQDSYSFKCGGTLISPNFLLTAAHCSKAPRDTSIVEVYPALVRFGVVNIDESPTTSRHPKDVAIIKIISHPKYASPMKYYDIALIQLEKDVEFTEYIHPACLWSKPSMEVGEVTVTGWGVTDVATRATSSTLMAAEMVIIDYETCDMLLKSSRNRHFKGLQDHQFCAGNLTGGVDTCQGDSGGPLQVPLPIPTMRKGAMYHVLGVTSFGMGCGIKNMPGVYTRVSKFLDWIENIVWK